MNCDHTINTVNMINFQKEDCLAQSSCNPALINDEEHLKIEDPIVYGFIQRGNKSIATMTNLTIGEFMKIYADIEQEITIVKMGTKPKISPKYSLFLTLVMLKKYLNGRQFQIYFILIQVQ